MQMGKEELLPNQAANKEKAEGSRETVDPRESVSHGRESHIVNKEAEERARRDEREERGNQENPTMPTGDSTLRTEI